MKRIGVIIGTDDEPVSKKYYKDNKKIMKPLEDYYVYGKYIPYDFAIFAEIKAHGEKNGFEVVPLFGQSFTLKDANECDFIFTVFEGVYSFMHGGMDGYKRFMNILKKTSATVFPSQKMQEFVINKHKYMTYLDKKGYNITPTKFVNLNNYSLKPIMAFINKNQFKEIIVKPELGAFKTGFKIIKNVNEKKVGDYLESLRKKDYGRILIQEFIPEFNKYGEIKTYWINGKNIYSYKQQWKDGEGVFQPQEKIEKELLKECLDTARKLLTDILKDHEPLIQCRVDFACCMNNDKRCREFFINEIEISPTIGEQESNGKAYRLLAKEVINYCS
jgi:glutathione synthase/RimK-type ligase-like ATP-grasp enzyme